MKKKFKKTHRSYYKKIFFFMLAFVMVVVLPFAVFLYKVSQENMLDNINQSNERVLRQMKFNYTYYAENISALCLSTFFRYDVKSVMYNNEPDYNQLYLTIRNLKDNILQSQPSLTSIEIYNAQRKEWYSTDAQGDTQGEVLKQYMKGQESVSKLRPVLRKIQEKNNQIDTSQYVFSYFMYEYADPASGKDSYIVFNQNANWFIDNLTGALSQEIPASLYLSGESGDIFGYQKEKTDPNEEKLVKECREKYDPEKTGKQGYYVESYQGKKFLISYIDLEDQGNLIIMVQEYEKIFSNLIQLKNDFLTLCAIFSVLGIVMLVLLSRRIYRPVDSLVDFVSGLADEDNKQLEFKEKDEFEHLRGFYEKTNQINKELLQERQTTKGKLKRYMLSNLLEESSKENWEKYLNSMPAAELAKKTEYHLMVLMFYLDDFTENRFGFVKGDRQLLLCSVTNVMTELLSDYIVEAVDKESGCKVMIIEFRDMAADSKAIVEKIHYMQEFIKAHFAVTVSASFSHISQDPEMLSTLYEETKKYASYRLIYGPNALLGEEQCRRNMENTQNSYPRELNKRLKESLKLGNMAQIQEVLVKIRESVSELSYDNITINMMALVTEVNTVMNEVNMAKNIPVTIHFNDIYRKVIEVDFIQQVFDELIEYIGSILSDTYQMKEKENDKEKIFVQTVIDFINDNYTDVNLSSQTIADNMKMSGRYVMKKFKQCTGISLNEYILDIRMKQAAYLLTHSRLPVNKIAENIGIENDNYFYRLFKKVHGCTPREFSSREEG